jgi:hypothetical protein
MAFSLNAIVPWGRSFDEYVRMFALTDDDLTLRIVSCADGPASFNAEMFRRGLRVVSCDPLYQFTSGQIESRITTTYDHMMRQARENEHQFNWSYIKSLDELGCLRTTAMNTFLADYETGRRAGRYVVGELPDLPFKRDSFDIALCSHFLFVYSVQLSLSFHQQAIKAMCGVAREVRIFPLLTYNAEPSPFIEALKELMAEAGYWVSIESVPYEFVRGGDKMLRVSRSFEIDAPLQVIR